MPRNNAEVTAESDQSIDWDAMIEMPASETMNLSATELNSTHEVTFLEVRSPSDGLLVARVDCETLAGDSLWLRGRFGPQNGLMSLVKAADGGANIEGQTFTFTRIESDKSPAGYAFRWTVA
tara:strand:+ start:12517 stop:12882 length:366 start_codon:yes stop_codon:yes gene_type:complete